MTSSLRLLFRLRVVALVGALSLGHASHADAGNLKAELKIGTNVYTFDDSATPGTINFDTLYRNGVTLNGSITTDYLNRSLHHEFDTLMYEDPSIGENPSLTFDLYITATGYSFPTAGTRSVSSTITSTEFENTASTFTVKDYFDGSNAEYGTAVTVGTASNPLGNMGPVYVAGSTSPFSLTRHVTFTLTDTALVQLNGQMSVMSAGSAVPVPAGLILLATGLPCLGLLRARRRPAAAPAPPAHG